jgi:plastocyanin
MKTVLFFIQIRIFLLLLAFPGNVSAKIHDVTVSNFAFSPDVIPSVEVGDTIRWIWASGSHTTTSTSVPGGAATWDAPISSSSTTFDYPVLVAGNYTYKCTPHFSMGMVGSFTAEFPSGTRNQASSAEISVFPNPFVSRVAIRYQSPEASLEMLSIYDLTGRKLREIRFEPSGTMTTRTLDLADLSPGVMVFEFRDQNGKVSSRKAVKN